MSLTNKRTPRSWSSRAHYAQCGDARDRILRAALDTRDTAPTGTKSTRSITIGIQCENNTAVARTRTRNTTRRPIRYLLPRPKLLLLTAFASKATSAYCCQTYTRLVRNALLTRVAYVRASSISCIDVRLQTRANEQLGALCKQGERYGAGLYIMYVYTSLLNEQRTLVNLVGSSDSSLLLVCDKLINCIQSLQSECNTLCVSL